MALVQNEHIYLIVSPTPTHSLMSQHGGVWGARGKERELGFQVRVCFILLIFPFCVTGYVFQVGIPTGL